MESLDETMIELTTRSESASNRDLVLPMAAKVQQALLFFRRRTHGEPCKSKQSSGAKRGLNGNLGGARRKRPLEISRVTRDLLAIDYAMRWRASMQVHEYFYCSAHDDPTLKSTVLPDVVLSAQRIAEQKHEGRLDSAGSYLDHISLRVSSHVGQDHVRKFYVLAAIELFAHLAVSSLGDFDGQGQITVGACE
jgi:hypothetical protein